MSQDIELPGIEKAAELIDSIYVDAFFSKLAEFGYQPRTEDDVAAMLQTGFQTDYLPNPTEKQAAASPFVQINAQLGQLLNPQHGQDAVKQAAFALATDPDVYKSVLAVKAAQAEQFVAAQAAAGGTK